MKTSAETCYVLGEFPVHCNVFRV